MSVTVGEAAVVVIAVTVGLIGALAYALVRRRGARAGAPRHTGVETISVYLTVVAIALIVAFGTDIAVDRLGQWPALWVADEHPPLPPHTSRP